MLWRDLNILRSRGRPNLVKHFAVRNNFSSGDIQIRIKLLFGTESANDVL